MQFPEILVLWSWNNSTCIPAASKGSPWILKGGWMGGVVPPRLSPLNFERGYFFFFPNNSLSFPSEQADGTSPSLRWATKGRGEGPSWSSRSRRPGTTAICACRSGTSWRATTWACCKCLWRKESSTVQQCGDGRAGTAGGTPRSPCGERGWKVWV